MLVADLTNVSWRKSSYSGQGGDCVEVAGCGRAYVVGANWRKASYSGAQSECVEVAVGVPCVVPVRDSKDPGGPALLFPADAWSSFVAAVKIGEFPAS